MSSIASTVAIVCTMATCPEYVIDTATNADDAIKNTSEAAAELNTIWQDEKGLKQWLKKHQIGETIFEIVSIDIERQDIPEEQMP